MYADVIVDISVEALDRAFQYQIPMELENEVVLGSCVRVPFGKGNRKIQGFVIRVSDKPDVPIARMKRIESVEKNRMFIENQLLSLAGFIRENYGGTMNEALKTVLPVKRKIKSVEKHWLNFAVTRIQAEEFLQTCLERHYKAKARLVAGLLEQGCMTQSEAVKRYKVSAAVVNGLKKQGILCITSEKKVRNPISNQRNTDFNLFGAGTKKLNSEQQWILDEFCVDYETGIRRTYLLHGVTGSGKTEVYLAMAEQVLTEGKQVIVLIPEIALTKQTVVRFQSRFGNVVSILNSRMSQGERSDQYERAAQGEIRIVVGPRSALFVPFEHLGLIIIDEEHEPSYKSESTPKYHTREVAIERARLAGASVVLGSATPSLESYDRAEKGEYKKLVLERRAGTGTMPLVHIVDLREELKERNYSIFSRRLQEAVKERLEKKEQVMLFLNRRGFAGFVSCRNCGNVVKCPHCDISYKVHKNKSGKVDTLTCHYCGNTVLMPERCPECGSPHIAGFGIGTEQLESMAGKMFPEARVLRMDADTTMGKDGHEQILSQFREGRADLLIGTQMIVKGHDFPNVTLVGVMAADLSLFAGDYRSSERTFQLLMQAGGRAGRGKKAGEVIIQTYQPEHHCIQAAAAHDYRQFYEKEMAYRNMLHYPPVYSMAAVLFLSKDEAIAARTAEEVAEYMKGQMLDCVFVIGPARASVSKINDWYRFVFYLKSKNYESLVQCKAELERYIDVRQIRYKCGVQFDMDPVNCY